MRFAILLPVFNHLEYTRVTLEELYDLTREIEDHRIDIVLIDDGSTDGTSDWVKQHYPDVIILSGDGNLWWSGAINLGARHSIEVLNADYLLLWNNDIGIDRQYFHNLFEILADIEDPVVIGSKIYIRGESDLVWSAGGYFNPRNGQSGMHGYFEKDTDELNKIREVDLLTGMGTIVPAKVVESIGFWDQENFPQYHGDSDFTYRAKLAGYSVRVYPQLRMYNDVDNSGIEHEGSFRNLIRLFSDIRSKSNLKKNLKWYRLYAKSPRAYLPLIWLYLKIIGGFIKWKIIRLFTPTKRETA